MTKIVDITEHRHWFDRYDDAKAKEAHWKSVAENAKQELLAIAGDDVDIMTIDGRPVLNRTEKETTHLTVAMIRERYPNITGELEEKVMRREFRRVGE